MTDLNNNAGKIQPPTPPVEPNDGRRILAFGLIGIIGGLLTRLSFAFLLPDLELSSSISFLLLNSVVIGVLGILISPFFGVAAIILGIRKIKKMRIGIANRMGGWKVTAGIICSAISVLMCLPSLIFFNNAMIELNWRHGRSFDCWDNVTAISSCMLMYAEDYDGRLPPVENWTESIDRFIGSRKSLKCKYDDRPGKVVSYGMNAALSGQKVSNIANPAEVVLIYEANQPGKSPYGGLEAVCDPPRHKGGNHFAFLDAHGKWSKEIPSFTPILKTPKKKQ
jgi:hypothetical protein